MSTDIQVFAKKSKTYIHLDRYRFVLIYDTIAHKGDAQYQHIHGKLSDRKWINRAEMLAYLTLTPKVHKLDNTNAPTDADEEARVEHWCALAKRFVETREPQDEMFCIAFDDGDSDHLLKEGYQKVDDDDPRKLWVRPEPKPDTRTPEEKERDLKNVEDLSRALQAGYGNLPRLGAPLKMESLEAVMNTIYLPGSGAVQTCAECKRAGGSCAWDAEGKFRVNNHECAAMRILRTLCDPTFYSDPPGFKMWEYETQQVAAMIPWEGRFIVLGWYKERGNVEYAGIMQESEMRPLTMKEAEDCIEHFRAKNLETCK